MKNFKVNQVSLVLLGAALLTGCAATQKAEERYTEAQEQNTKRFEESYVKSSAASVANSDVNKTANFSKTTRNWVDPNPLPRAEKREELPNMFKKQISMTMPGTVNAVEVLSEMQRSTGIRFDINQDIYDTSNGMGKLVSGGGGGGGGGASKSMLLQIPDFVFRGSLEDALNLFASKANVSWKWNGREVVVYRYETKTYNIAALAGATKTSSTVDLKGDTSGAASDAKGGGSAANAGSSSSNVSRSSSLTTWEEVKVFLISQLSPSGSIAVLESAGAVTIKDVPAVHKMIEKSINDLNALLSKQIFLNVDVYAVSVNEGDKGAVDWNLVWEKANAQNKFGYAAKNGASGIASNFSIGVLTGPMAGSSVVVGALSSLGKTSVVNQFQVTTLNGQPTPIASNKKVGYVKEVKVSTPQSGGSGGDTKVELVPGEISAGINMSLVPKIEPNGNILLEYTMNLSDIEEIRTFTSSNGSAIEIPTSNLKSVLQRATLRSGQTLVLSGFKQKNANYNKSGVGAPSNMLMGGSMNAGVSDQYLVITVTPYIANSNAYFK